MTLAPCPTVWPSPPLNVCTCVSVTANGVVTDTCGAEVSFFAPVTVTRPVDPFSDQLGGSSSDEPHPATITTARRAIDARTPRSMRMPRNATTYAVSATNDARRRTSSTLPGETSIVVTPAFSQTAICSRT